MSVDGLLDHVGDLYRSATVSNAYGVSDDFARETAGLRAGVQRADATLRNTGAGDVSGGTHRIFFAASADVQARDVLDVTSGREAPVKLRVLSVTKPRGHHVEAMAEVWEGALPT